MGTEKVNVVSLRKLVKCVKLAIFAKKHLSRKVAPNTDGNPPVTGYLKTRLPQLTFTKSAKVSSRKATARLKCGRKSNYMHTIP